jgi:hypothetical protein
MLLKKAFHLLQGYSNIYQWAKFQIFSLKNNNVIRDKILKKQM